MAEPLDYEGPRPPLKARTERLRRVLFFVAAAVLALILLVMLTA
jgi:hypothetical protein